MSKLATIKVQGGEYATVPTRLKAFLEANPRAKITSEDLSSGDEIKFRTTIKLDQADEYSREVDGHARSQKSGAKEYEKTETISLGRCLSKLGYMNNGMIASTEEMEEFESYKAEVYEQDITDANTVEELMAVFNQMDALAKKEFTPMLSAKKKEIQNANA